MKQNMKNLLKSRFKVWWLVFVLAVGLLGSTVVFADDTPSYLSVDADSKTITVTDDSSVTSEIQDAINYITEYYYDATDGTDNTTGWTIVVGKGTYGRFFVCQCYGTVKDTYATLKGLTIKAADDATVAISVLDGSDSQRA